MQTLKAAPFNFEQDDLCRAYRELYQDQLVVITNIKPVVSDIENKGERRPRTLQYVKIQLASSGDQ
jgi:hypothetical protein